MQNFVSNFWASKIWLLFWVKIPFSWRSNHNLGIFCLTFVQLAKSVQILLFLSTTKTQVNGLHKNRLLLHTPTKRNFYHLHPRRSTKPQLAEICVKPVLVWLAMYTAPVRISPQYDFAVQLHPVLRLPISKFLKFPRKHNVEWVVLSLKSWTGTIHDMQKHALHQSTYLELICTWELTWELLWKQVLNY